MITRRKMLQGIAVTAGAAGLSMFANVPFASASILPKASKTVKGDVIVVGTGLAGSSAALQAAEIGAKVIILEKTTEELVGGSSKFSGGSVGVAVADTDEAKEEFYKKISARSLGKGNEEIMKVIAYQSFAATEWLRGYGLKAPAPMPRPGLGAKSVVFEPGMYRNMKENVLPTLRTEIKKKGGVYYFDTKARQLIMDDTGAVIGVRAETPKGLVDYMGKVVFATGGYAANKEMLEMYVGPDADEAWYRGNPTNTGDGHNMAKEAGAGLVRMGGVNSMVIGMVSPENTSAGNPSYVLHYGLCINNKGERYTDEGLMYGKAAPALFDQPGQVASIVFNQASSDKNAALANIVKQYETNNIPYVKVDTLEELARKINVPEKTFLKTISDYNAAVAGDKALNVTPQKTAHAMKMEQGPFYAFYNLVPGITLTFGGIKINKNAQVLQPDGRVIRGLYAAGECAGGVFHYEYFPVGLPCANALTMGRVAGMSAVEKI